MAPEALFRASEASEMLIEFNSIYFNQFNQFIGLNVFIWRNATHD